MSNIINQIDLFKFDIFINYFNSTSKKHISINQFTFSSQKQSKCRRCKQIFRFNNQLHNHLIDCHIKNYNTSIKSTRRRDLINQ